MNRECLMTQDQEDACNAPFPYTPEPTGKVKNELLLFLSSIQQRIACRGQSTMDCDLISLEGNANT